MSERYTKGEWKVKRGAPLVKEKFIYAGDVLIATVHGENNTANATLISASKDMYKALEAFDEYVSTSYPANIRLKQIAVDKMERAKAKAEGKGNE